MLDRAICPEPRVTHTSANYVFYVDSEKLVDGKTHRMKESCHQIDSTHRACVLASKGFDLSEAYNKDGRSFDGLGAHHAKVVRVGPLELSGSTNWSTAGEGSLERTTLTWLTSIGVDETERCEAVVRERSTPYALVFPAERSLYGRPARGAGCCYGGSRPHGTF